ncbi:S9 family peptidase [Actinomadura macra]|uniref:S9 family peptidase n=1 Tax=Actinomadura macra TaxID=46164 RepID=UPI000B2D67D9|nr:prolyl oligopeptidase family serine peptidase [Actinomadura macra]
MPEYLDFVPRERFRPALAVSPDGTTVAYSSNAGGTFDLWTIPIATGRPRRLTHLTNQAVSQIAYPPDGKSLVFTADQAGNEQYRIYTIAAAGGEPTELSSGPDCQRVLADDPFDADGRYLVYAANDRDATVQDILIRDLSDDSERRVSPPPGVIFRPARISPDGRWLTVAGSCSNTDVAAYLIDLVDNRSAPECLTAEHERGFFAPGPWKPDSSGFYLLTDLWGEFNAVGLYSLRDAALVQITSDDWDVELIEAAGDTLLWAVNRNGQSTLHARTNGSTVQLTQLPDGVVDNLAPTPAADQVVLQIDSATRPKDIGVLDPSIGFRYLTDTRPPTLRTSAAIEPDMVSYTAGDGRHVHALLYQPRTPGPHPLLLSIHGGPEAQERPRYAYSGLYQHLLANGIAIFAPNIAGSTGYGLAHRMLIYRDWGGADLDDLDHAVRYLRSRPDVEAERMAVMGASYGGFAALSCLCRLHHPWMAGASICGPTNLLTLAQACPPTWKTVVASVLGDPDTDAEHLLRRSPITYSDAIDTPLFVVQGAHDPRVPQDESDQIVTRLRDRGVDVRYDIYPDEGHGFANRDNEIKAYGDVAEFVITHLLGE